MTISVIETNDYKSQVAHLLNDAQRQAVKTLLGDDPFFGEEINVDDFSFLSMLWDEKLGIRIVYQAPTLDDPTVYLLGIAEGNVQFLAKRAQAEEQKTGGVFKQLGMGISTRVIVELLIKALEKLDWF